MKTLSKKIFLLALVLLITNVTFSQKNQITKANKEFDKYSFIDARVIYLKVVEEGYESSEIFKKLGDTYYFNSEYSSAAEWYQKLVDKFPNEVDAEYYYRAAQSLKRLDKYEESDKLMKAYEALGGGNFVVQNFKDDPDYLKTIAFKAKGYELEKVGINSGLSDFGPSYYKNQVVYASTARNTEGNKTHEWTDQPYLDLFVANMDEEGKLSNPVALKGDVNSPYNESSATFTKDGKTMYFTRNNYIDGKKGRDKGKKVKTIRLKLYKATKVGDSIWTNIEELPFNSDKYSVAHPALNTDETRLYFASDMPETLGLSDLWYVDITGDNTYGDAVNLGPSINTEARESFPFISKQNNLYFSSDGRSGLGGFDIYFSSLNEEGKPTEITNLGEPANSSADDFGFIIQEDKRIGYMSSNRSGRNGSIDDEIYRVQEKCEISIAGTITNEVTNEPLQDAIVTVLDEDNNEIGTATTDENGNYTFDAIAACETKYTVRVKAVGCDSKEVAIETPNETGTVTVDVLLPCDPCAFNDLGCRLELLPIYFDFDKYNIRPDAAIELAKILAALKEYPQLVIHIESHTDSRGNDEYNEVLSENRAQSTLSWLVDKGIDENRLTAKGYGEYRLKVEKCTNGAKCTEEEHQLNRRSMFIIQK